MQYSALNILNYCKTLLYVSYECLSNTACQQYDKTYLATQTSRFAPLAHRMTFHPQALKALGYSGHEE